MKIIIFITFVFMTGCTDYKYQFECDSGFKTEYYDRLVYGKNSLGWLDPELNTWKYRTNVDGETCWKNTNPTNTNETE